MPRAPVVCLLLPGGLEYAGGIGRWAGYLLGAWRSGKAARPEIVVVDTRGHGSKAIGILAFPLALLRLIGFLVTGRLALVHANMASRGSTIRKSVVVYGAALFGVPVIVHLHGAQFDSFYLGLAPIYRRLVRGAFARAQTVLVLGEVWRRFLIERVGVDERKITILHNGVPQPRAARPARPAEAPCHIVLLGRLEPRKGVPELISALAAEPLRGRAWRATLAGDGDVDGTRKRVAALGLADRIAVPGWIGADAADALLAEADILVLASHAENMPMSVLEALAHRVAVIATPVGTTPEILTDNHSVLLVPPGDVEALGAALLRLIDDPALRAAIAAQGHEVFVRRLDIAVVADRLTALYLGCAPRLAGRSVEQGLNPDTRRHR